MLMALKDSGHPDAARITEAIGMMIDPRPSRPQAASARRRGKPMPAGGRSWPALTPADGAYQLKITLCDVAGPPVWRRILVPAGTRLGTLAAIVELAIGWDGSHQHVFSDAGREYPDSLALRDLLSKPGDQFCYTYDFGDDWEHDIDLEDIIQNDLGDTLPACLDGSGACPPEDCGGPWRYAELKEILADPDHEEHEDMLDWLGLESGDGLDPVRFSVDEVNSRLSQMQGMSDFAVAAGPVPEVVRIQRRAKKTKAKRRR
jgi:hypothetical protein